MSHRTPVDYVDLTLQDGLSLEKSISEARTNDERRRGIGYDQIGLDTAAELAFANGAFEEWEDDMPEIVEEFYPGAETPSLYTYFYI